MITAKDVMTKKVVSLPPEMRLRDAIALLLRRGISGAPVADRQRRLLGVLSQTDLVRRSRAPKEETIPAFYRQGGRVVAAPFVESPEDVPVSQAMTPVVLSAEEDTPVSELAGIMLRRRIHRVMITRDGKLSGIVTSIDMLRALAREPERPPRVRRRPVAAAGRRRGRRAPLAGV